MLTIPYDIVPKQKLRGAVHYEGVLQLRALKRPSTPFLYIGVFKYGAFLSRFTLSTPESGTSTDTLTHPMTIIYNYYGK